MIVIDINNSVCKVSGVTRKQLTDIRHRTLYKERTGKWVSEYVKDKQGKKVLDPKTRKFKLKQVPQIIKHFLTDRKGNFPTGLLYIVEDYFHSNKIEFFYRDKRIEPKLGSIELNAKRQHDPDLYQRGSAAASLEYGRGIIVAPTGFGKSTIAAEVIDLISVPTLLVVPNLGLKAQLTQGLREIFGESNVGPLFQGQAQYKITVENIQAIDPKKPIEGVDLLLIDEFHHSGADTYLACNKVAWSKIYFKIGMTATPFRTVQAERLLLESVLSHVIYRIEYKDAIALRRIVPMEAYYVDLPEIKLEGEGLKYDSVYKELVVNREDRNEIIARLATNLEDAKISFLVLVKQVLHGEIIENLTGYRMPFIKGENDDNSEVIKAFNRREHNGVIGTAGVMGEGVDTKPCEYVIVAGLGKSKSALMQQFGRAFRAFDGKDTCKIIIFRDPSHKWTLEHFEEQCKILREEYGVIPVKLDLD